MQVTLLQLVDQSDLLLLQAIYHRLILCTILEQLPELLSLGWVVDGA